MKLTFWLCLILVGYTYFGYAVCLWIQSRFRQRPVMQKPIKPTVSIILAVRNEEANLPAKLENLKLMDYPVELRQIVIASDGSTDRTVDILGEHATTVLPVVLHQSTGKAHALNEAVKRANGEILVFFDARQNVAPNAISELVSCFADADVGAVSGELLLIDSSGKQSSEALGLYWKIEKTVRKLESASGSTVGVTGAIYAMRRDLYTEIPVGTILDDVLIPMHVARKGKRVIFHPSAMAHDHLFNEKGKEFSRKVRTLTGNYQLLSLAPWLLSTANPLRFRFISHKLLRLIVPLLLVLMLTTSLIVNELLYRLIFSTQILFYALAICGSIIPSSVKLKPIAIANAFVMLNIAALVAFRNFVAGRDFVWH
jgi:biofilm PGA synthesis N-glycosyltransferase PgaC